MTTAVARSHPIIPQERTFPEDQVIVSKTDTRGIITYVNHTFLEVSQYTRNEVIGKPHNIVRHPEMPRAGFKLLWDYLKNGKEIFAYVINQSKYGDYYWVFAHVTPTFDANNKIIGYHSNRRSPRREAIEKIIPLYKQLLDIERQCKTPKEATEKSYQALVDLLAQQKITYDEFVLSL